MPPAAQPTTSQQALQQLQQFNAGAKAPADILKGAENQLGVGGAQQQVSGLRQAITNTTNLLNQIPSSVQGRTGQSLVTEAQATRQIGNEQAPVSAELGRQSTAYGNASADLTNLESRAQAQANAELQGQTAQQQNLQSIYDRLFQSEQAKQAADLAAQQEAERVREFNVSSGGGSGGFSFGGGGGTTTGAGGTGGTPTAAGGPTVQQQNNYNQARQEINNLTRQQGSGLNTLLSDYMATLKSANYGNQKDILKIAAYNKMFPQYFGKQASTVEQMLQIGNAAKGRLSNADARYNFLVSLLPPKQQNTTRGR